MDGIPARSTWAKLNLYQLFELTEGLLLELCDEGQYPLTLEQVEDRTLRALLEHRERRFARELFASKPFARLVSDLSTGKGWSDRGYTYDVRMDVDPRLVKRALEQAVKTHATKLYGSSLDDVSKRDRSYAVESSLECLPRFRGYLTFDLKRSGAFKTFDFSREAFVEALYQVAPELQARKPKRGQPRAPAFLFAVGEELEGSGGARPYRVTLDAEGHKVWKTAGELDIRFQPPRALERPDAKVKAAVAQLEPPTPVEVDALGYKALAALCAELMAGLERKGLSFKRFQGLKAFPGIQRAFVRREELEQAAALASPKRARALKALNGEARQLSELVDLPKRWVDAEVRLSLSPGLVDVLTRKHLAWYAGHPYGVLCVDFTASGKVKAFRFLADTMDRELNFDLLRGLVAKRAKGLPPIDPAALKPGTRVANRKGEGFVVEVADGAKRWVPAET